MRDLAEPKVLKAAAAAALVSALACLPQLVLWDMRKLPIWYLEAILFLGGIVLWAFVFAWHAKYAQQPPVVLKIQGRFLLAATGAGLAGALLLYWAVDPTMRARTPEDYPKTVVEWISRTLFSLTFTQLFLVFAPFAWLIRLFRRVDVAVALTIFFGIFVVFLKSERSMTPMPTLLLGELLFIRLIAGIVSIYLYLRGGILLVWWWELILQSRHLWALMIVR